MVLELFRVKLHLHTSETDLNCFIHSFSSLYDIRGRWSWQPDNWPKFLLHFAAEGNRVSSLQTNNSSLENTTVPPSLWNTRFLHTFGLKLWTSWFCSFSDPLHDYLRFIFHISLRYLTPPLSLSYIHSSFMQALWGGGARAIASDEIGFSTSAVHVQPHGLWRLRLSSAASKLGREDSPAPVPGIGSHLVPETLWITRIKITWR